MTFKFFCHVGANGRSEPFEDYENATPQVQAGLDAAVLFLENLERHKWTQPRIHAAKLTREAWSDFYELRFFADKVQQRPIGFFGPNEMQFTIVIWCIEKGSVLLPIRWFKTANKRRLDILAKTASTKLLYPDEDE